MSINKALISGSTDMLVLKLIEKKDMYGYQIIEELARQSNKAFELKAGTLYPLLHILEQKHYVKSYEAVAESGKKRKYYRITGQGVKHLQVRFGEWNAYATSVNAVMQGGTAVAGAY